MCDSCDKEMKGESNFIFELSREEFENLRSQFDTSSWEVVKKMNFDAIKFMRQERDRVSKKIKGMPPEKEIEYFKKKSEEFRRRKW
jgi:hypothetical protein